MRTRVAVISTLLMMSSGLAQAQGGKEFIADILTEAKGGWTVLRDYTPELTPTERASKGHFEFLRRGGEVVGRTTHMLTNCEFKVVVRETGFDFQAPFRGCDAGPATNTPLTALDYDAADPIYPFKRLTTPQKWWLTRSQ